MVALGPWLKGMNNRASSHALPAGSRQDPGAACRNAVNIDFDNEGNGRRRGGLTKVYNGLNTKGGFSCPLGDFFIENGSLKQLHPYAFLSSGGDQLVSGVDTLIYS